MIRLLPKHTELRMFDNSVEVDPAGGIVPKPRLVLHLEQGQIVTPKDLSKTPHWDNPIVVVAMRLAGG